MRLLYRWLHLKSKIMISQNVCRLVTCKKRCVRLIKWRKTIKGNYCHAWQEGFGKSWQFILWGTWLNVETDLCNIHRDTSTTCKTQVETSTDCLNSIEKWFILKGPWVNFKMSKCSKGQMVQRWVNLSACLTHRIIEKSLHCHCTNTAKLQEPMLEFMTHNTTYIL